MIKLYCIFMDLYIIQNLLIYLYLIICTGVQGVSFLSHQVMSLYSMIKNKKKNVI